MCLASASVAQRKKGAGGGWMDEEIHYNSSASKGQPMHLEFASTSCRNSYRGKVTLSLETQMLQLKT